MFYFPIKFIPNEFFCSVFNLPAPEFSNLGNYKLESDYLIYLTTHYAKLKTI